MKISLESIAEEGNYYKKFLEGIKDSQTKRHYVAHLEMFLNEIPDYIYDKILNDIPDNTIESKSEHFVLFAKKV